jgi:hypothetical protein
MSRRARRNHTPAFKAKVALAAVKGDRLIANRFVEEFDGLQGNKVYRLSNTPVITIPNATIPLAAPRCRAYLLDQTASGKCFRRFRIRGRCASETLQKCSGFRANR